MPLLSVVRNSEVFRWGTELPVNRSLGWEKDESFFVPDLCTLFLWGHLLTYHKTLVMVHLHPGGSIGRGTSNLKTGTFFF